MRGRLEVPGTMLVKGAPHVRQELLSAQFGDPQWQVHGVVIVAEPWCAARLLIARRTWMVVGAM